MDRRDFLKTTGVAIGVTAARALTGATQGVSIVVDAKDPVASAPPVAWAVRELQSALKERGITAEVVSRVDSAAAGNRCFLVAGAHAALAQQILRSSKSTMPEAAEALCLVPGNTGGRAVLLVGGSDARGLVYALLELVDRVRLAGDSDAPLDVRAALVEQPANVIRSCARSFESDVEDKVWFHNKAWWGQYLTALAASRFNRFNLATGLGYNGNSNVPDAYLYFAYPFLLSVPGYDVRIDNLPDAERDLNLEMLRFVSDETVARGMQFNLSLWSHAYQWRNPASNYRVVGLTPQTHAPYCRDAITALLKACPNITGLSFRMHSESGIPAGSYAFWETAFQGIKKAGRRIDLDLHAKGTDERHINIGLSTGNPVSMVPKFWAEHNGMPYMQASIRELERRQRDRPGDTEAERGFLRYGYGDYLKDDRNFGIIHRIWPGTQRHLLWGDPIFAAGYGRAFNFSGSLGYELLEPLSFKGRMGSGKPGGRNAYADKTLETVDDWERFKYEYRLLGRLTYNPNTDPDVWRRALRHEFQNAAGSAEAALGSASRILAVITTAHDPSASNNSYWPEMYTNQSIVQETPLYSDTPDPKVFGTVSALDPQLFATVEECAEMLVSGRSAAKYTPLDVAEWLEALSAAASENAARASASSADSTAPATRRLLADVAIQAGIGRFFAYKFRSAVLWSVFQRSGDKSALSEAVNAYRAARDAWRAMAEQAKAVYASDITYGPNATLRGHWLDRLPAIDSDIAEMEKHLTAAASPTPGVDPAVVRGAIRAALSAPLRPSVAAQHTPVLYFDRGRPIEITLSMEHSDTRKVRLAYRHADQSKAWQSLDTTWQGGTYHGTIPAEYTDSPFPLLYYFEIDDAAGSALYPGFGKDLAGQPYFLVRSRLTAAAAVRKTA
ncbi:MAG TPA: hypothetical protein VGZ27_06055 [Vicinamibacterales bacterium]|jgi:hypothetical protein|nr:hypothetical protein [Vicinamibacterales bacterium]